MMTCKELVALMTDYLEGKLSAADRSRFEAHVDGCRACVTYLNQLKHTITTLGRVPDEPIPSPVRDELLQRFRDWKKRA
ncbi:MAG: zf-HC2 domain-containing protein [Myxococcota bacterium]